jgi:hypothetical protein
VPSFNPSDFLRVRHLCTPTLAAYQPPRPMLNMSKHEQQLFDAIRQISGFDNISLLFLIDLSRSKSTEFAKFLAFRVGSYIKENIYYYFYFNIKSAA